MRCPYTFWGNRDKILLSMKFPLQVHVFEHLLLNLLSFFFFGGCKTFGRWGPHWRKLVTELGPQVHSWSLLPVLTLLPVSLGCEGIPDAYSQCHGATYLHSFPDHDGLYTQTMSHNKYSSKKMRRNVKQYIFLFPDTLYWDIILTSLIIHTLF